MLQQMSKRERTIAFIIGGVTFLLLNIAVIKFFTGRLNSLKTSTAQTQTKIDALKLLDSERTWWSERDAWITQTQPVMGDPMDAQRSLTDLIKAAAQKNEVHIETAIQSRNPSTQQYYTSVPAELTVKGTWKAIFNFIYELQHPEKFIILEPLELKVDATDKSQIRATMTVQRWFKPTGRP